MDKVLFGMCSLFLAGFIGAAGGGEQSQPPVQYPEGFRRWTHVKSGLVGPQNPAFQHYVGLHHIYANEIGMDGYASGRFADGSVLVFDLLETRENSGITTEGSRRFIDVMRRDSQLYATTGGWGFEEFSGDGHTGTLTTEAKTSCYNCHATQKARDFVFSLFRK
jgi:hypothetical protein